VWLFKVADVCATESDINMEFGFHTDEESKLFCERIIEAMELLYDINQVDGIEVLNNHWGGLPLAEVWILYHETEREWAERLGNTSDYSLAGEAKRKSKQAEAERRIAEFRRAGQHEWLYDS
jgi:hypothetical protein